jgi:benzoyl-CoA-dihydrodiol lyase
MLAAGAAWWPLAFARELDDALLTLRTNEPTLGLLVVRSAGDPQQVLNVDRDLARHAGHWFVRETVGLVRRTLARLEVTSRSIYAVIDRGSAFAGTLFELALAADRIYMLADDGAAAPQIALSEQNFGAYPTVAARARLAVRFNDDALHLSALRALLGQSLDAGAALANGLVTAAPDEIDWDDELRLAIEERVTLSPDALSGLEANLRFPGPETLHAKIFGRLSAWQNWIFIRPNATGEHGALKRYGSGSKPQFDQERV